MVRISGNYHSQHGIIVEIPALLAIVRGWLLSEHISARETLTMILPKFGYSTLAAAFNFGAEVGA